MTAGFAYHQSKGEIIQIRLSVWLFDLIDEILRFERLVRRNECNEHDCLREAGS